MLEDWNMLEVEARHCCASLRAAPASPRAAPASPRAAPAQDADGDGKEDVSYVLPDFEPVIAAAPDLHT